MTETNEPDPSIEVDQLDPPAGYPQHWITGVRDLAGVAVETPDLEALDLEPNAYPSHWRLTR